MEAYTVAEGTTWFTESLELMFFFDIGSDTPTPDAPFVNNGTLWNRCLNDYLGTVIASQNFGPITNNGLIMSEAPTGQALTLWLYGSNWGLNNTGEIYAVSYKRGAFAIIDYSANEFVNTGLIAAQRIAPIDPPGEVVYQAFAITRHSGGRIDNQASGEILAEGARATAIWSMRGHLPTPGYPDWADIENAGRIEAVATDSRFESVGVRLSSDEAETLTLINSGTIRADIAIVTEAFNETPAIQGPKSIVNLDGGLIDGTVLLCRHDETIINSGVIAGDVWMFEGDDLVLNAGRLTGAVQMGEGHDQYLGADALTTVELNGESGMDLLVAGAGADRVDGGEGNDWIVGGGGADLLIGGMGADRFVYQNLADSMAGTVDTIRGFTSGEDKIDLSLLAPTSVDLSTASGITTVTAHLAAGDLVIRVEGGVILSDILSGPAGTALNGTDAAEILSAAGPVRQLHGGAGADLLSGSSGNDLLDGGPGADIMRGGAGNDVYIVDDPIYHMVGDVQDIDTDRVIELDGEGVDEVRTYVTYTLPGGVENITFLGPGGLWVEGNRLDNIMVGNDTDNTFDGRDGDDVLIGGGGSDFLHGAYGADRFVYRAVSDSTAAAYDELYEFITGVDKIDLTALPVISINWTPQSPSLGTTIQMVTVETAAGWMTIRVDSADLAMTDFLVADRRITGTTGNDILIGGPANDLLDGGAGADRMEGGAGNDTYIVDNAADKAVEAAGAGTDTVLSSISHTLGANLENLTLTGSGTVNGTGNALANILTGNSAANRLDGRGGGDVMRGGAGNDIYMVDAGADKVVETSASHGVDTVKSSVSFRLGAHVEHLTLTGTAAVNGTGNELANRIIGNAAANVLDGRGGADRMQGGAGNDTYIVDHARDLVIETSASHGLDLVRASVSHALRSDVENLVLVGSAAINATGNDLANVLTGNGAANVLNGRGGADLMRGGAGDDVYVVDDVGDKVVEGSVTGGTDTVKSAVSFRLGSNLEHLTLTGTAAIDGTGNALANRMIGNGAANVLNGGAGADVMKGGGGDDTYIVDHVGDRVLESSAGHGLDTVRSGVTFALGSHVENLVLTGSGAIDGSGNGLANTMSGNGSANILRGASGDDLLQGGGGADQLYGGTGHDLLVGGTGADLFHFHSPLDPANADTILDFVRGADRIVLENAVFKGLAAGALAPGALAVGPAATTAAHRIVYDPASGALMFDPDGSGAAAAILFATLDNMPATLAASDFQVI